ncbi:SulP family inorganic anion transporter [Flammeovirga kamogawensis]|uniref:SulP family inorganic anion transporter n=1 Tax=Flammeovirga kamogawensis TaxID=373891 RepID=A0ABX8GS61_9BACT|nr:SulP family inorganic anion transporter [Flammeovirga kamogawensis]MBB6464015.1 SulP family sulfate permease [Flammeovirga kamogawensis]QWG06107.1 SulP family inorganic anion transporter [Flammeovirga kamogawensis]TRX67939.1 SulP family inorganic anion transporter [Flammeovirga kamogawensis]
MKQNIQLSLKGTDFKTEILSGLTVAIALVPEAIAFSFIAGVSPLIGLYAAFVMGLVTAVLGGRPGMISGATGAIAVVVMPLIATQGVDYLFPAIILGGIFQILVGAMKLGKFIRLVPHPVMLGFVNGLAIVIFKAQFSQFHTKAGEWMSGSPLYIMLGLVVLAMLVIQYLPKLTKVVPSPLMAIAVVSGIVIGFGIETPTVGDMASISGGLPSIIIPNVPFDMETLMIILPFSLKVAGVGLIESLLTLTLIDEITETRGSGNRESVAQGLGNIISGFTGGMGGCAMIGQSMINIQSGARQRWSGIIAAVALLSFVIVLSSVIEQIPIAALVGVMFMVAIGTFEWSSLRVLNKVPKFDVIVLLTVSIVTVIEDLAVAVVIGIIMSALSFAWDNAVRIRARKKTDEFGRKHYEIYGPLFFGSATNFFEKFDFKNDPEKVIIDFSESRVADLSGIEAINKISDKYEEYSKEVTFIHLSQDCVDLLAKAKSHVEIDHDHDPHYAVVYDA